MSATDTSSDATHDSDAPTPVPGPKRLQPHQISVAIGIVIALIVVVSGIAASTLQWHDDSPIQREVFGGVPGALKFAFYVVIPIMFIIGSVMFANRVRNWERGGPDRRTITPKNAKKRMEKLRAGLYMQTLLRDPAAGIMHSMIYFGFLVLLAVTSILEINHQLPEGIKFLHGGVYEAFSFIGDLGGVVFLTVLSFVDTQAFFLVLAGTAAVAFIAARFLEEPEGQMAEALPDGTLQLIDVK